jgi:hypothetical protein
MVKVNISILAFRLIENLERTGKSFLRLTSGDAFSSPASFRKCKYVEVIS